jgi:drug/metabolite transporter (DMT)-like permease
MRLRLLHVPLLAFAAAAAYLGGSVIARGLFDRSYDNTIWSYLGFGVPLLVGAVAIIAFVIRDARTERS